MRFAFLLGACCAALTLAAEPQTMIYSEPADFAPSKGLVKQEDGSLLITSIDGFHGTPAKALKIDPAKAYELKYEIKLADGSEPIPSIIVSV